jgi:hypothetical protein
MAYAITLHTGQTGTRLVVTDRAAVDTVIGQLKNPDGIVSINPGHADRHGEEVYVPVRAIVAVTVTKA